MCTKIYNVIIPEHIHHASELERKILRDGSDAEGKVGYSDREAGVVAVVMRLLADDLHPVLVCQLASTEAQSRLSQAREKLKFVSHISQISQTDIREVHNLMRVML